MGKKIVTMGAAKSQGGSAPISNKSKVDGIQADFSRDIQGVATSFGALLGMTKWYGDMFPQAMEQLKKEGCKCGNQLHGKEWEEFGGWAWDRGKRHES